LKNREEPGAQWFWFGSFPPISISTASVPRAGDVLEPDGDEQRGIDFARTSVALS
jgi:hypothetical protein